MPWWELVAQLPWSRIGGAAATAWSWASSAASRSYAVAAAMPTECKQATVHAGQVCAGITPEYHLTPGFGPWPLGWGWMLARIFLGMLLATVYFQNYMSRSRTAKPTRTPADGEWRDFLDHICELALCQSKSSLRGRNNMREKQ